MPNVNPFPSTTLLAPTKDTSRPNEAAFLDTFLRLPAAFPEHGLRVHISTAIRWVKMGRNGVKLDARRIGGRWYCTRRAALAFIQAGSQDAASSRISAPVAISASATTAAVKLDKLGF